MDITIREPYYAPKERLPAPLPTEKEIQEATEEFESTFHRIVRIGPYVVKHGTKLCPSAGENMLFVREAAPGVQIPQVYAVYSVSNDNDETETFIVMEYIEGRTLKAKWPEMEEREKLHAAGQLRAFLDQLRAILAPGYFGALGRQPYAHPFFQLTLQTSPFTNEELSGPFDDAYGFVTGMLERFALRVNGEFNESVARGVAGNALDVDPAPVFSHGDLDQSKIMCKSDGTFVLLGWEVAGWYPMFWEFAMATYAGEGRDNDWYTYLACILKEYPIQYLWIRSILRGNGF